MSGSLDQFQVLHDLGVEGGHQCDGRVLTVRRSRYITDANPALRNLKVNYDSRGDAFPVSSMTFSTTAVIRDFKVPRVKTGISFHLL